MGCLTVTKEWYRRRNQPEGWKDFWYDPKARHYYFIGKDNIVFHTIIWPAILLGYDKGLDLPYDVPATQFLNFSGEKMSAGRGKGVWLPDLLERFDPDQIRYYGIATMPETKDTDFEWEDFERRNNSELLAVYMAPVLPFSAPRLWHALGYDSDVHATRWEDALEDVPAGQKLRVGKPLFSKIELGEPAADPTERFDVRVARIVDVKEHPNADKLYILEVDLGDERRQIVAGIRSDYTSNQPPGRTVALLAILQAARLRGVESRGMLLAAEDKATVGLLMPPEDAATGSQILGVKGAPTLPFSEFQKFRFQVGPGGTVEFQGRDGEVKRTLAANGAPLRVDKDLKEGSWVH